MRADLTMQTYYTINEDTARHANNVNSFSDYNSWPYCTPIMARITRIMTKLSAASKRHTPIIRG